MTGFIMAFLCIGGGFGGYMLADWAVRQMIDWHLEKLNDPQLQAVLAKRYTDDRICYLCARVNELHKRLDAKREESNGHNPAAE